MLPIIDLDIKGKPEETKVVVAMSGEGTICCCRIG